MPTVSEVLGGLLDKAVKNPRTTISSFLTAAIGSIPILLASGKIGLKGTAILTGVLTTSKLVWGTFFQSDPPPK